MAVDAIGSIVGANAAAGAGTRTAIDQEGFIRLFLSQLQFQDPLEPMDNREFLAQLAQFSNLEQSRQIGINLESLLVMTSADQALALLNRQVEVASESGGAVAGTVKAVRFTASGPELTVDTAGGMLTGIRLSQLNLVRP